MLSGGAAVQHDNENCSSSGGLSGCNRAGYAIYANNGNKGNETVSSARKLIKDSGNHAHSIEAKTSSAYEASLGHCSCPASLNIKSYKIHVFTRTA